jgi:hypothetical protein
MSWAYTTRPYRLSSLWRVYLKRRLKAKILGLSRDSNNTSHQEKHSKLARQKYQEIIYVDEKSSFE